MVGTFFRKTRGGLAGMEFVKSRKMADLFKAQAKGDSRDRLTFSQPSICHRNQSADDVFFGREPG